MEAATVRATWTDERLDDFREHVDQRFDAVDQRFDAVDRRFAAMDQRFDKLDEKLEDMDHRQTARIDALNRTLVMFATAVIAILGGGMATLIGLLVTLL